MRAFYFCRCDLPDSFSRPSEKGIAATDSRAKSRQMTEGTACQFVRAVWALLILTLIGATPVFGDDSSQLTGGERKLHLGTAIGPEEMKRAHEALRQKMTELNTNTPSLPEVKTNAVLTVKLVYPFPDPKELPPPATPSEALRRKMREMDAEEQTALHRAANAVAVTNSDTLIEVKRYEIKGFVPPSVTTAPLAKYIGTNITRDEIATAAADLQADYRKQGLPDVCIAFALTGITNGTVTFNVAQAASPQIVISGKRYVAPPPVNTNPPAKFEVCGYELTGDTLLSNDTLRSILGTYTGTNIGVAEILKAGSDLQMEYRTRGYPTVNVTIPPQQITNKIVKIRVFEGELADIIITNRGLTYFSSNNVVRALPSLRKGEVLVGPVFQGELDRANANQDRQIYPQIVPGPRENTSALILDVRDRLPLHGKVELNNQNSPGTPDLRVNSSAMCANLWQLEHSAGVQYNFSPQFYKSGRDWAFYDRPLVATYSGFYRMPLGDAEAMKDIVANNPNTFGYQEASRRFKLPAPSGRPELNFYASRAAIDTGLENLFSTNVLDVPGVRTVTRNDVQQDLTINQDIGMRLSLPLQEFNGWHHVFSFGVDFKTYEISSAHTNIFSFTEFLVQTNGSVVRHDYTLPTGNAPTRERLNYLPVTLRYDGSWRQPEGKLNLALGLGMNFNTWYSPGTRETFVGTNKVQINGVQAVTQSRMSSGHWITFNPSWTADFMFHTNWVLSLHQEAQWSSEPLISTEQFGAGGVANVRGYHEGEVFGDTGWRVNAELKTPPYLLGRVYDSRFGNGNLMVRGAVFMDYARVHLLDPQGRSPSQALWGTGLGIVGSLGSHWESRLLFAVPLDSTSTTTALQPYFSFALTAQF